MTRVTTSVLALIGVAVSTFSSVSAVEVTHQFPSYLRNTVKTDSGGDVAKGNPNHDEPDVAPGEPDGDAEGCSAAEIQYCVNIQKGKCNGTNSFLCGWNNDVGHCVCMHPGKFVIKA